MPDTKSPPDDAAQRRRTVALVGVLAGSLCAILLAGLGILAGLNENAARALLPWWDDAAAARENGPALAGTPPLPVPPPSDPAALEPVTTEQAVLANAEIPFSIRPNFAAGRFVVAGEATSDRERAIGCLTAANFYEAAGEGVDGMRAVAQVVLNRVRHPAFPKSVCGVVFEGSERRTGCQFSFTCDGSLARQPSPTGWLRARAVALAALAGMVDVRVGLATHYHTRWVLPYWAKTLDKNAVVGSHIFYRWRNGWGSPSAFRGAYARAEPAPPWTAPTTGDAAAAAVTMSDEAVLSSLTPLAVPLGSRPAIGVGAAPGNAAPGQTVAEGDRWVIGAPPPRRAPTTSPQPAPTSTATPAPRAPATPTRK